MLILTSFLPGMVNDPGYVLRVVNMGWTNRTVVHLLNNLRQWPNLVNRILVLGSTRNAMNANIGCNGWCETGWTDADRDDPNDVDFTTDAFICQDLPDEEKEDIMISKLADDVVSFPQGNDRGILTEVIQRVINNPSLNRNFSDIQSLIQEEKLSPTPYGPDEDLRSREYWTEEAKKYSSRIYDTTNGEKLREAMKLKVNPKKRKTNDSNEKPSKHARR
jgi:hypothetical protein